MNLFDKRDFDKQAEVQAEALAEIVDDKLATKQDIKELELKIDQNAKDLELKIELIRKELIIKLGSIMLSGLGLLVLLIKLFKL